MSRPIKWCSKKKDKAIDIVLFEISEENKSLRSILGINRDVEILPSRRVFNKWLSEDIELSTQYAHACKSRAENIFDEIIEIADENDADVSIVGGEARIDGNTVQRSRLKIDARKWALSKMNPKKYGDKIEATIEGGDKPVNIVNLGGGVKPD